MLRNKELYSVERDALCKVFANMIMIPLSIIKGGTFHDQPKSAPHDGHRYIESIVVAVRAC